MNLIKCLTILILMNSYGCEVWVTESRHSYWNYHYVRKQINQTIVFAVSVLKYNTVLGCAVVCSSLLAERGVSLYHDPNTDQCHCNIELDNGPDDAGSEWIFYGQMTHLYEIEEETDLNVKRTTVWPYKSECEDLRQDGYVSDGIYSIISLVADRQFTVCDMTNGGWTIIQRRFDGSEDFNRDWNAYRYGFGNTTGEYWLGLENIHRLTKDTSELSVSMEAFPGLNPPSMSAHYSNFYVGDHASKFVLQVSGFTGTCGNAMMLHSNGMKFTTYDSDNDIWSGNCAVAFRGGGWHSNCHSAHPNGHYFQAGEYSFTNDWATGIHWMACWSAQDSLRTSILKIRKKLT